MYHTSSSLQTYGIKTVLELRYLPTSWNVITQIESNIELEKVEFEHFLDLASIE